MNICVNNDNMFFTYKYIYLFTIFWLDKSIIHVLSVIFSRSFFFLNKLLSYLDNQFVLFAQHRVRFSS